MSDLVPMYSLDKVTICVRLPIELAMKIEKRAKEKGVSISHYATTLLYAATHNDPWTEEDEKERRRIYDENVRKRKELTAKRMAARSARSAKAKKEAK